MTAVERTRHIPFAAWLKLTIQRFRSRGLWFGLGRLRSVRRGYGALMGLRQRLDPAFAISPDAPKLAIRPRTESIFGAVDVAACGKALRRDGLAPGFRLPQAHVAQIVEYASRTPLSCKGSKPFLKGDVRDGRLPDGRGVSLGMVHRTEKGLLRRRCAAVDQIVRDPQLLEVVRRQLGYWPGRVADLELFWTFVSDLTHDEKMAQGNSLEYHYDVCGYNFVMADFYLTDTDRDSGAHVMVLGSQGRKPLRMLWRGHQTDAAVHRAFGAGNELVIEGRAGDGFVADNSCYHKSTPPQRADRLFLRVVYS